MRLTAEEVEKLLDLDELIAEIEMLSLPCRLEKLFSQFGRFLPPKSLLVGLHSCRRFTAT